MGVQIKGLTEGKTMWEKEYIDFEFDGKCISEFGLVAVSDGDRYSFAASSEFSDETTEVKGYDGQHFWGTNLKAKKTTYSLATDGMTEEQLNAFKRHFQPGKYGKFIDSHLSHRYSYRRLAEVVEFKLIPFQVKKTLLGQEFYVNEYKGEARITFVQDDPYSYSEENYIEEINPETARAIYTNGIPVPQSWINNEGKQNINLVDSKGDILDIPDCHLGADYKIATKDGGGLVLDTGVEDSQSLMFYNPSNVDTSSTFVLTLNPEFTPINYTDWQPVYFCQIADNINITRMTNFTKAYNSIEGTIQKNINFNTHTLLAPIDDDYQYIFNYSTPNIIYSINRAIQIAWQCYQKEFTTILELEELLRDEIAHEHVLSWVMSVLYIIDHHVTSGKFTFINSNNQLDKTKLGPKLLLNNIGFPNASNAAFSKTTWFVYFNILMLLLLGKNINGNIAPEQAPNSWNGFYPLTIEFNGEKYESKVKYFYNLYNNSVESNLSWEEKSGDMNQSKYLLLDGGDTINQDGQCMSCHFIRFLKGGQPQTVANAKLKYKYTYV